MYQEVKDIFSTNTLIQRTSDGAFIPIDENNVDYQVYLAWVAQGNSPLPPAAD